jgi:uncharacterized alkaline shock family protein YloU
MAEEKATPVKEAPVAKAAAPASRGTTVIGDSVVSKVADVAAREVQGVIELVGGVGGTLRKYAPGISARGVGADVEVGRKETIIELDLIVAYGVNIPELAEAVRTNVIEQIEYATGLEVKEVNIEVSDVDFPKESRVE